MHISNGNHLLTVVAIDIEGQVVLIIDRNIQVKNSLVVRGTIDNPKDNEIVSGIYNISGWVLEPNGVKRIQVLVDGMPTGCASYGYLRTDVFSVYSAYNNKNSGFKFNLDTTRLNNSSMS